MDSAQHPVAIIGGGLAGNAAAISLAQNGWPATVFERDTFPRDKLCGEFLSGESRRMLHQLGCLDEILRYNPPEIREVRFITGSGRRLLVPLSTPALGISRRRLDETLFNHAQASGADMVTGCEIVGIGQGSDGLRLKAHQTDAPEFAINPRLTIGAHGRRSRLDRDMNRPFLKRLDSSIGLKLHHHFCQTNAGATARRELANTTEIYALNGGYCGIALVENDVVNVCMLLKRTAFARIGTSHWPAVMSHLAQQNPALGARLAGLHPANEPVLTVSQMPFSRKEKSQDGILYAGDAAGMIAPLCGDGMAMALQSGISVATLVMRHFETPTKLANATLDTGALHSNWTRDWNRTFQKRIRLGKVLQRLLLSPISAELAVQILNAMPSCVTAKLAALTRGR